MRVVSFAKSVALLTIVFGTFCCGQSCASAIEMKENEFVRYFIGMCVQTPADYNRVISFAKTLKWEGVNKDIAMALSPADSNAEYQMWQIKENEKLYIVGVSKAKIHSAGSKFNGKTATTCSVVTKEPDLNNVEASLSRYFKRRSDLDYIEVLHKEAYWETLVLKQDVIVSLLSVVNDNEAPIRLTATVVQGHN